MTMTTEPNPRDQHPEQQVPEGFLPAGDRPLPGPRPARDIWAGTAPDTIPEAPSIFARARLTGIDAARGIALFGMFAVHTMPTENPVTGGATTVFAIFGGRAAALFAVLAGISLALITGRETPHRGGRWWRSAASISIRAVLIFSLGIGLNYFDLEVYNILPYYGILFLLAIPFTRLGAVWSFLWAGVFLLAGPVMIHLIVAGTDLPVVSLPTFQDLAAQPAASIVSFLATGTYPALSWLVFFLVGLGLGRLPLAHIATQANIIIGGGILALAGPVISGVLLNSADRWTTIVDESRGYSVQDVIAIDVFGPRDNQPLPADSWWWLAVDGPHTNTPPALLDNIGVALIVIGTALLVSRAVEELLTPLIAAGSMTLTLYTAHLLAVTFIDTADLSALWLAVQIIVASVFATGWMIALGRGPLERIVHDIAALPKEQHRSPRGRRQRRRRRRIGGKHAVV